ncbi:MAG: ABC-F family ATP-binding cassette domain-containing protein [Gammaproteobacteria bacterium]|nr:ABC-F family ATP-binding cassette domain-containing protein [Gammaproteobacteria bacterium]MYF29559.1 ABC-F family ATP-binding cassette domain-containing protein [Gammaproteobacteria bacterium]MYK44849.1 ABC-F family ATP-binding cassette domain-containing protein [Gammaproteobacteria bacterium]
MSTIICRRLTFGYPGSEGNIFEDFDLVIDTRWRCALAGRNGRGKTTLLRLLHGELVPDKGGIERASPTAYFPPRVADSEQRVRDVVKDAAGPFRQWESAMADALADGGEDALARYGQTLHEYEEAGGYTVDAGIEAELSALCIDERSWDRPFSSLSGGEQTRCLLASLFVSDGSSTAGSTGMNRPFVLIDEPTNHLDANGRQRVAEYLRSKPGFLLVSHDRAFLDTCCDHVVALNRDTVEVERASFSDWRRRFRGRLERQRAKNVALKQDIVRLGRVAADRRAGALKRESEKAAHTDKGFISRRAKRQMKRALVAERRADHAADERRRTLVDVEKERHLKLPDSPRGAGSLVVANDLSVWRGDKGVFAKLSFTIARGDRVAVVGPNGSGKTTLLDMIGGASFRHAGTLSRPGYVSVARTFQHPEWTSGLLRDRLRDAGIDESRLRQIMASLGVRGRVLDGRIEDFSHGQQKKVDLARTFLTEADLLLWDEPLNFIDIDAREQIEDVLLRDKPTVVFVEHDAAFMERVATQVIRVST